MTSSSPLEGFDNSEVDRAIALSHKVDNIISLIHSGAIDSPLPVDEEWDFSSADHLSQESPPHCHPPRLSSLSTVFSHAGVDQRIDPDPSPALPGVKRINTSVNRQSVSSEESYSGSHSSRSKSVLSISTVKMVSTAVQKKSISSYFNLLSSFEDELEGLSPNMISPNRITFYLELSNDLMRGFRAVVDVFTDNLKEDFDETMLANAITLKDSCKSFYRALMARDNESPVQSSNSDTGLDSATPGNGINVLIAQQRVNDLIQSLDDQVRACAQNFKSLLHATYSTSFEVKSGEVLLKQYSDNALEIQKQVTDLVRSATTAGDNHSVRRLDGFTLLLNNSKSASRLHVANAHTRLGILPGISDTGVNRVKFKSPYFDGTLNPKSLDYFTFESEIVKYFSVVGLYSDYDRGLKLKSDCLGGQALACIGYQDLYSKCMELLKVNFGKPNLLFLSRQNELRNCNKCPEGVVERREWLLTVKELLRSLTAMTVQHKLQDLLDSSNIMQILQTLMRDRDHEEFRELIKKKRRENPSFIISKRFLYSELSSFLDRLSTDASTELDYALTSSYRSCMDVLKPNKGRSSAAHQSLPIDQPNSSSSTGSEINLSNLDLSKETPLLLNDHCSALPDSIQPTGVSQAHVINRPDKKTPPAKTYPPAAPMNKSETPKYVSCRLCKKEHTHLFYCSEFRKTRPNGRFRRCLYAQGCPRCLRLDVGLDFTDREEWFQTHKQL